MGIYQGVWKFICSGSGQPQGRLLRGQSSVTVPPSRRGGPRWRRDPVIAEVTSREGASDKDFWLPEKEKLGVATALPSTVVGDYNGGVPKVGLGSIGI